MPRVSVNLHRNGFFCQINRREHIGWKIHFGSLDRNLKTLELAQKSRYRAEIRSRYTLGQYESSKIRVFLSDEPYCRYSPKTEIFGWKLKKSEKCWKCWPNELKIGRSLHFDDMNTLWKFEEDRMKTVTCSLHEKLSMFKSWKILKMPEKNKTGRENEPKIGRSLDFDNMNKLWKFEENRTRIVTCRLHEKKLTDTQTHRHTDTQTHARVMTIAYFDFVKIS